MILWINQKQEEESLLGTKWLASSLVCKCFFLKPGIGLGAINDTFLLDVGAAEILRQLYPAHPQVEQLCIAYQRSKKLTVLGQFLDITTQGQLKSFTWER